MCECTAVLFFPDLYIMLDIPFAGIDLFYLYFVAQCLRIGCL